MPAPQPHDPETIQVDRAAGGMTLTSWVMLGLLTMGAVVVTGSTIACEVRGRDDCLQRASTALAAVGLGGGLLFTHSPAEGAMAAMRGIVGGRRKNEPAPGPAPITPSLPELIFQAHTKQAHGLDPREVYAGGRRG